MARVTVEDCLEIEDNRFKLVLYAAKRAREISSGAQITVAKDNDKNPVIALREIAEKTVCVEEIEESIIRTMQRHAMIDDNDADLDSEFEEALGGADFMDSDEDILESMEEDETIDGGDQLSKADAEAMLEVEEF